MKTARDSAWNRGPVSFLVSRVPALLVFWFAASLALAQPTPSPFSFPVGWRLVDFPVKAAAFAVPAPSDWRLAREDSAELGLAGPNEPSPRLIVEQRFLVGGLAAYEPYIREKILKNGIYAKASTFIGPAGAYRVFRGSTSMPQARVSATALFSSGRRCVMVHLTAPKAHADALYRLSDEVFRGCRFTAPGRVPPHLEPREESFERFALRLPEGWKSSPLKNGMTATLTGRGIYAAISVQRLADGAPRAELLERARGEAGRSFLSFGRVRFLGADVEAFRLQMPMPTGGECDAVWMLGGEPGAWLEGWYFAEDEVFETYRDVGLAALAGARRIP